MELKNRAEDKKRRSHEPRQKPEQKGNPTGARRTEELEAPRAAALHLAKQKRHVGDPDLHESERALSNREEQMGGVAHHGCKLGVGSRSLAGPARNRWQGWPPAAAARGEEEALKRSTRAASVKEGRRISGRRRR